MIKIYFYDDFGNDPVLFEEFVDIDEARRYMDVYLRGMLDGLNNPEFRISKKGEDKVWAIENYGEWVVEDNE